MPTSACASAGVSLMPSPTIAVTLPAVLELGDLDGLVLRQHLGEHVRVVDTGLRRDRLGGPAVVAGDHERLDVHLAERGHRLGRVRLQRVGHGDHAGQLGAVHANEHDGLALVFERADPRLERRDVDALALHELAVAKRDALAHDRALDTVTRNRREALDLGKLDAVGLRTSDDGLGQRVLGVALKRRGQREHAGRVVSLGKLDVGHLGRAVRERAGLVEDDRRDLVRVLERLAVLDQDAVALRPCRCRP